MDGSVDFIRLPMPCPSCGRNSLQPLRTLVTDSLVVCTHCGDGIDVSNKTSRAFINKARDFYAQFRDLSDI